jgi:hypothetical protein
METSSGNLEKLKATPRGAAARMYAVDQAADGFQVRY